MRNSKIHLVAIFLNYIYFLSVSLPFHLILSHMTENQCHLWYFLYCCLGSHHSYHMHHLLLLMVAIYRSPHNWLFHFAIVLKVKMKRKSICVIFAETQICMHWSGIRKWYYTMPNNMYALVCSSIIICIK